MSGMSLQDGRVFQTAFVVENLEDALPHYSRLLDIGGWLVIGGKRPWSVTYRGKAETLPLNVALGYAGEMMYELIEQCDRTPSVYMDVIGTRGYGFHHWAVATEDIDTAEREQARAGHPLLMTLEGRQGKALYIDARAHLPGMLEIVKLTPEFRSFVAMVYGLRRGLGDGTPVLKRL